MIRRISTKWVLTVLAIVVLPFLGFFLYVDSFVTRRFADDVVRYHLMSHAAELSERLDRLVDERQKDVKLLSKDFTARMSLAGDREEDLELFGPQLLPLLNTVVQSPGSAEFVLAINRAGRVQVTSTIDPGGTPLDGWTLDRLETREWHLEPWFEEALSRGAAHIDVFESGLIPPERDVPVEARYHFGFAHVVEAIPDDGGEGDGVAAPVGVIVSLLPWSLVQAEIETYGIRRRRDSRTELASEDIYASSYAWIWASDADTILAHDRRELYGRRVSEPPIGLPHMVEAARSGRWGMYPDYEFDGIAKRAAFRHGKSIDENGFGWVIGVGVNVRDIVGPIDEITLTLAQASGAILLLAVLATIIVARRTTRPIQELEAYTTRIAATGDLDTQVPVHGSDELSDLARSFNRMTRQLKENRVQLVKAEKDAAWREMARQVAHEIKNPLTPIQLSVQLLKRAHEDGSPEFPAILDRTTDVVHRQVNNMRDIAKDFYRFAGEHREPVAVDAGEILDEQIELHAAWAETEGLELQRVGGAEGPAPIVLADPDELRRAILNLVSNAIEACSGAEGASRITGRVEVLAPRRTVRITIEDDGPGLSPEAADRLFEPYFTTRSSGTGLGLAIVRRIVEDLGGTVHLENRRDANRGARAAIELPLEGPTADGIG